MKIIKKNAFGGTAIERAEYPEGIEEFSPAHARRVVSEQDGFTFPASVRVLNADAFDGFKFEKGTFRLPDTLEDVMSSKVDFALKDEDPAPRPCCALPRSVKHLYTGLLPKGIDLLYIPCEITHLHVAERVSFNRFFVEDGNEIFFTNEDHTELYIKRSDREPKRIMKASISPRWEETWHD